MRDNRLPKASDLVAAAIRAEILHDGLEPGDRMPSEAELIEIHQRSRGTVREALRLLEADGLVTIKRGPAGGITVRHPDVTQVSRSLAMLLTINGATLGEFFAFRMAFEPVVAHTAALIATPKQREEVVLAASRSQLSSAGRLHSMSDFHTVVGKCSNNVIYSTLLDTIHQLLEWHTASENLTEADLKETELAHISIAHAIRDGDGNTAAIAMSRHIESYEALLSQKGRSTQPIIPPNRWHSLI